jgi:hypothetical protein
VNISRLSATMDNTCWQTTSKNLGQQEETDSDIDLIVLLEGPVDGAQEIRRIWTVLYPLQLRSHRGVLALMHRDYVKPGRPPVDIGRMLSTLADLRSIGDYGGAAHVSHTEATMALSEAQ